jgi:hypothetical protein
MSRLAVVANPTGNIVDIPESLNRFLERLLLRRFTGSGIRALFRNTRRAKKYPGEEN